MRLADLNEELYLLRQGTLSVTSFFTQLKKIWSEIENFRPINPCVCGLQCVCKSYREQDFIMRFLKGLKDRFSGVRSQILLLDPLPPINKVFGLVVQQERQLSLELGEEPKILAATSQGRGNFNSDAGSGKNYGKNKFGRNNTKMCTFCGRSGHTIDTCFKKHGYPPNQKKWGTVATNLTSSNDDDDDDNEDDSKGDFQKFTDLSLSKEQLQGLMSLLQSQMQQVSSSSQQQQSPMVNQVSASYTSCPQPSSGQGNTEEDWIW
ncbi:hypothetical protein PIB30_118927 [Stylosanthes scabra]|uniref:Retrotransposon gag domain-containing protein n=1 Tax=Stylosanthes scabra TaxID=79078 RepID=A0ABU6X6P8_9FABA|nr:hypothetical protein [Stylosanthes scabra]